MQKFEKHHPFGLFIIMAILSKINRSVYKACVTFLWSTVTFRYQFKDKYKVIPSTDNQIIACSMSNCITPNMHLMQTNLHVLNALLFDVNCEMNIGHVQQIMIYYNRLLGNLQCFLFLFIINMNIHL